MWSAVEALEEHAELTRKVAGRMVATGRERAAEHAARAAPTRPRREPRRSAPCSRSSDVHPEPEAA